MPSPGNQSRDNRGSDWLGIARTFVVEVLVLLALAGAFVGYLNWSSNKAFEEFMSASEPSPAYAGHQPPSAVPIQQVKAKAPCQPRV
jgi:hypothetical protein